MESPWIEGIPVEIERAARLPRVYTPRWNLPITAIVLGNTTWVRYQHYDSTLDRRVPCSGGEGCSYCPDPTREPTGWHACWCPVSRKPCILQFSSHALGNLAAIKHDRPDLRGAILKTERTDRRPCARMVCTLFGSTDAAMLPAEFDPRPSLERMWGMSLRGVVPVDLGRQADEKKPRRRRKEG